MLRQARESAKQVTFLRRRSVRIPRLIGITMQGADAAALRQASKRLSLSTCALLSTTCIRRGFFAVHATHAAADLPRLPPEVEYRLVGHSLFCAMSSRI